MSRKKRIREKGKINLSKYFQNLKEGDKVCVVREPSIPASFPERLQGRTGIVEGKRGEVCMIKLNDFNEEKRFLIAPIHLKKIK